MARRILHRTKSKNKKKQKNKKIKTKTYKEHYRTNTMTQNEEGHKLAKIMNYNELAR